MAMCLMPLCVLLSAGLSTPATGCPVEATIAYSRDTTPGIPQGPGVTGSPGEAVLTTYFIYVVVGKGTVPSVSGLWLKGAYYAARLEKVRSPVLVEHDTAVRTGEKDTLVPATSSDVYQLHPGEKHAWSPSSEGETQLTRNNELVVFVDAGGSRGACPVPTIKRLLPAAGM